MPRLMLRTKQSDEKIREVTDKLNKKYHEDMEKAVSRVKKFPNIMLQGNKEAYVMQLEMLRDMIIPFKIDKITHSEDGNYVIFDVDKTIIDTVANNKVIQAFSKIKITPSRQKIAKDIAEEYEGDLEKWLEEIEESG